MRSLFLFVSAVLFAFPLNVSANQTGISSDDLYSELSLEESVDYFDPTLQLASSCYRQTCKLFAYISKAEQKMYLYIDGQYHSVWKISTGSVKYPTPNFDRHPNGRIYDKYTSSKYPEGDYGDLGNMPYSVFVQGDYAIHGTPAWNWAKLGTASSHGCIRMHPKHAFYFNRLVQSIGIHNTWITVE